MGLNVTGGMTTKSVSTETNVKAPSVTKDTLSCVDSTTNLDNVNSEITVLSATAGRTPEKKRVMKIKLRS